MTQVIRYVNRKRFYTVLFCIILVSTSVLSGCLQGEPDDKADTTDQSWEIVDQFGQIDKLGQQC